MASQTQLGAGNAQKQLKGFKHRDPRFRWQHQINDSSQKLLLEVKEAAVNVAIEHGSRIARHIQTLIQASTSSNTPTTDVAIDELQDWINRYNAACSNHKNSQIYVGVAGSTGAGKTSILNALLDIQDILPASNEEASTSAVCFVAWNDDDTAGHDFRAEVTFKDRDSFAKELDLFFLELKDAGDGEDDNGKNDSDASNEDEQDEEQVAADSATAATARGLSQVPAESIEWLEKIEDLCGLTEDEILNESTESLLDRNPEFLKLLGTTKVIHDSDAKAFATNVRPYLDASSAEHFEGGREFAASPLIKEVRIYMKADILRNGIILVDLPGLSDASESRQAIAQKYFSQLTLTVIVAPIRRGADEQTGCDLMSENQELSMQMDGKFHKKGFCVVLSMMDAIEVNGYLAQHKREAKNDEELQEKLDMLAKFTDNLKNLNEQRKKEHQKYRSLKAACNRANLNVAKASKSGRGKKEEPTKSKMTAEKALQDFEDQEKVLKKLKFLLRRQPVRIRALQNYMHFWCIRARNRLLHNRIQRDFARRQKAIMSAKRKDLYDGTVNIFPVSASSYWAIPYAKKHGQDAPLGFPEVTYTGIPALKAWLQEATMEERSKHLGTTLNTFFGLFNGMKTWSSDEWINLQAHLDPAFIKRELLDKPLKELESKIDPIWRDLDNKINKIDPTAVKNKKATLNKCRNNCVAQVKRWNTKDPRKLRCKEKIHFHSYGASLNRHGGSFVSKGKGNVPYHWNIDLASIFLKIIVENWNAAFNEKIPDLEGPALTAIDKVWLAFLETLRNRAQFSVKDIIPLLDGQKDIMTDIKDEIQDKLEEVFRGISRSASNSHPDIPLYMQSRFKPAYLEALEHTKKGQLKARQAIIEAHAEEKSRSMYADAFTELESKVEDHMGELPDKFRDITAFAKRRIEKHITLLLSTVGTNNKSLHQADDDTKNFKEQSRRAVRGIIAEWDVLWRIGAFDESFLQSGSTNIPEQVTDGSILEDAAGKDKDGAEKDKDGDSDVDMDLDGDDEDDDLE